MASTPPITVLREEQQKLSAAYVKLDALYRHHQSRRMAPIANVLASLERGIGLLSELITALAAVPGPTPREIAERGYL